MDEKKLIPYVMNKWYGGQSENEFMSSGTDFASSQNINIYESPKSIELAKDFTQITSGFISSAEAGAHGFSMTLIGVTAVSGGLVFTANYNCLLTIVTKSAFSTATRCILQDSIGVSLETVTFIGNTATFTGSGYSLILGNTYKVITDNLGSNYTVYGSTGGFPHFPATNNITLTSGIVAGLNGLNLYNITAIETKRAGYTGGYITKILNLPNDIQSKAYFTSTGEIYIETTTKNVPVLVYTITKADKYILNAICFTTFLLVFTSTEIHRITFTANNFKTYASITESLLAFIGDYQGFSTNESRDLCIYNFKDTLLYFSAGNKLFSVGNTLSSVSTSETFRKGSKIVGLSFLNSNLKVYINYLNVSSSLYFWNETSSDSINYKNKVFKSVITDGQLDYVVCSDGLYIFNGYTGEKLFNNNFNDFGKSGSLYFVPQNLSGIDPYFRYVAYNKNIYKFGKKFTNLQNAFSLSSVETNNITAISDEMTVDGTLYYADDAKKAYYQGSTYKTTGQLEGIVFYGDTMEKVKKLVKIFNAFDIPTGCSIDFYFSVEGGAYPLTPTYSISASTTLKYKELFANELLNLKNHWIKPKIILNGNGSTTPKLYEFSMFSEYIQNI